MLAPVMAIIRATFQSGWFHVTVVVVEEVPVAQDHWVVIWGHTALYLNVLSVQPLGYTLKFVEPVTVLGKVVVKYLIIASHQTYFQPE